MSEEMQLIFGVRIVLNDYLDQLTENTSIGLYNTESDFFINGVFGENIVYVDDASVFDIGDAVFIRDDTTDGQESRISAIDVSSNKLTIDDTLTWNYSTANNARVVSNSKIRWIQNAISGLAQTWNEDMLVPGGIATVVRTINLDKGGNVADVGGFNVKVQNTDQLWKLLDQAGVYFPGRRVDFMYFDADTKESELLWTGNCGTPNWNSRQYVIPCTKDRDSRNVNLTEQRNVLGTDDTTVIPVVYGKFADSRAAMVRTVASELDIYLKQIISLIFSNGGTVTYTGGLDTTRISFPIVGTSLEPALEYVVELGLHDNITLSGDFDFSLDSDDDALYLYIVRDQNARGSFRRISRIAQHHDTMLKLTLEPYYAEDPAYRTSDVTADMEKDVALGATQVYVDSASSFAVGDYIRIYDEDSGLYEVNEVTIVRTFGEDWLGLRNPTINAYSHDVSGGAQNGYVDRVDQGAAAWCKVINLDRQYEADTQELYAFLDDEGNKINTTTDDNPALTLYAYKEEGEVVVSELDEKSIVKIKPIQFFRLPEYAYTIDAGDNDKNRLVIAPTYFDSDVDTMSSYLIKPVKNVQLAQAADLSKWGFSSDYVYKSDGLYVKVDPTGIWLEVHGNPEYTTDKDYDTRFILESHYGGSGGLGGRYAYLLAVQFEMPDFPNDFVFDNMYLGIWSQLRFSGSYQYYQSFQARWRGWIGPPSQIIDDTVGDDFSAYVSAPDYAELKSLPDFYYSSDPGDGDLYFYVNREEHHRILGIQSYDYSQSSDVKSRGEYDIIDKNMMILEVDVSAPENGGGTWDIRELAIVFQKKIDVKETIFTYLRGRVFTDTWENRRVESSPIDNPVDIFEDICRRQDWSEYGRPPEEGWGQAISPLARIKLDGIGNFDDINIDLDAARQILDFDSAYTKNLKKTFCRDFWLANYVDNNGYECLVNVAKYPLQDPDEIVTLYDIPLAQQTIKIEDPSPANIYPEPFVRYRFNSASGEYDSSISFNSIAGGSGYIDAPENVFSESEEEEYVGRCASLLDKSIIVRQPPSYLTDLAWAQGDNADDIAKAYITNWIDWQAYRKVSFSVHFLETAGGVGAPVRKWHEGKRFYLDLPHETNNSQIECELTKITINPNPPHLIAIEAVMLSDAYLPPLYYIKDTHVTQAEGATADWVDHHTEYGTDQDKKDNH